MLEGLRGFAALMVVFYHVNWPSHVLTWSVVRNGYAFVDVFFVLSGFIMTHVYGDRLTSLGAVGRFFWLRIARLVPLHFATLFALVVWRVAAAVKMGAAGGSWTDAFTGIFTFPALLTNLLLIHSLGVHDRLTWNNPSWSISTEFYTYALFALLAGTAWLRTRAWTTRTFLFLVVYGALFELADSLDVTYDLGAFRCVAGFLLGSLLYGLARHRRRLDRAPGRWDSLVDSMVVIAVVFAIGRLSGKTQLLLIPAFGVLLFTLLGSHGVMARALTSGAGLWLGRVSYSLYMVHWPIRVGFEKGLSALGRPPNDPNSLTPWAGDGVALVYASVVLVAAALSYRWIEMPWRARARRWLRERESR